MSSRFGSVLRSNRWVEGGGRRGGYAVASRTVSHEVSMMAMRHDELSEEELARKRAIERSWDAALRAMADPEFREHLDESIDRVNRSTAPVLTRDEFLAQTASPTE